MLCSLAKFRNNVLDNIWPCFMKVIIIIKKKKNKKTKKKKKKKKHPAECFYPESQICYKIKSVRIQYKNANSNFIVSDEILSGSNTISTFITA